MDARAGGAPDRDVFLVLSPNGDGSLGVFCVQADEAAAGRRAKVIGGVSARLAVVADFRRERGGSPLQDQAPA